jgi:dolichol-phosphate mannosyltransferase
MVSISIVLPAYLEAANLRNILPEIHSTLYNISHEILVVDTMQPMDNTEEVCLQHNAKYIPRTGGNYYGDAIRTGFRRANSRYVVVMDADGSHNPKDIIRFYNEMEKEDSDLIIGSRYCEGGSTVNPAILIGMSFILNSIYRLTFGLNVKDVSDSYRMYRTEQIKNLHLECNNFDIVEEILIRLNLSKDNYIMKEIPIKFNKRVAGESKRNLFKFILSYITTMIKLLKIKHSCKR